MSGRPQMGFWDFMFEFWCESPAGFLCLCAVRFAAAVIATAIR